MHGKLRHALEKLLRNRGFTSPDSRRIIANQLLLTAASLAVGAGAAWFSLWPLAFGIGAALASANLWWIARGAQWCVAQQFSPALALVYFGSFLLRFAGTGLALYLLLAWLQFPLVPLLAGLFSVVVYLSVMGFSRIAGNSCKEA